MNYKDMITNYRDMTLGMYLEIMAISERMENPFDRNPEILSILTGVQVEDLMALPIPEFGMLMRRAGFLLKPPQPGKTRKTYAVASFELEPVTDFRKITTSQYVDFQTFLAQKSEDGSMVEILSVMLVPKGRKYCDGYDALELQKAIREKMSVEDAVSLYGFFSRRFDSLIRDSLTYCLKLAKRLPDPDQRKELTDRAETLKRMTETMAITGSGVGSIVWTRFQRLSAVLGMRFGE